MLSISPDKLKQIIKVCQDKSAEHVYVFGSHAYGQVTALSDFDLAVFLNKTVKPRDYLAIKLRLMTELENILSLPKVDVVILNSAPTMIKYMAVTYGKLIYSVDKAARFRLEHQILQAYEDFLPYVKQQYYLQRQAIIDNRFGQPLVGS